MVLGDLAFILHLDHRGRSLRRRKSSGARSVLDRIGTEAFCHPEADPVAPGWRLLPPPAGRIAHRLVPAAPTDPQGIEKTTLVATFMCGQLAFLSANPLWVPHPVWCAVKLARKRRLFADKPQPERRGTPTDARYIFITGGVVSSLGQRPCIGQLWVALLQGARGFSVPLAKTGPLT